jgi:hypothetical protein
MLPRRGIEAQDYKPVNRSSARDASEAKAEDGGEAEKKNGGNPISLANAMSEKVFDEKNFEKVNDVRQKSDRNDVEKNGSPDQNFCGPESFTEKEPRNEKDLAGDVGESVEQWETWEKPGSGAELQGGDVDTRIRQDKRLNKATEPRGNPPTMTPDDPPPWIFKENINRMSEAFPAEREGQRLCGVTGSTKIGRG